MKIDPKTILDVRQLSKSVNLGSKTIDILQNVDLEVNAGETIAIVGSSGSGKTTLLSIIAGLDIPTAGEVYLKGHALHQADEETRAQIRGNYVGFIFQQFLLIPSLSAKENIMLPAELANLPNAEALAQELLEKVGLGERADHFPSQLSGGEQQRVAIARAFITQPDILFADEPTGNLDKQTGSQIENLLFELHQQAGTTLVVVTHDPKLAQRCQRQVVMDSGHLNEQTPKLVEVV
ncbi:ABC transporter ATP-binding protein [Thalassotalea sp. LPB0316]|uniref:ABC transporter ATP-binding protein n=1 Tax=Thalassotalea sp. LPB0316 TaxID=2769490 RepID=UPI0018685FA1|nr:ABC transporter ATP-binding protein [Thalassotalea sp. LPB0316]QOL24763.1 ABC transporter ATP-binding protein [Thalassotalea sp. LPB0316]